MRSAWRGSIQCGLLVIPVRLGVTVPTSAKSMFHRLHKGCGGQIRQVHHCEVCDVDVDWADIGKGAEVPGVDGLVEVTDGELEALRAWETRTASVEYFCPAGQIDPLLRDQAYYVAPGWKDRTSKAGDAGAARACALLRDAMTANGVVGVCRIGYATSDALAVLEVVDGEFLLTKLWWPELLRGTDADTVINPKQPPLPQEVTMARQLLQTMTRDFDPAAHVDTYREAIGTLLAAKATDGTVPFPVTPRTVAAAVPDLTAVLRQSIDSLKAPSTAKPRQRARKAS